jgi:transcriptional regulator with GAF, ATPase, and Fis domain
MVEWTRRDDHASDRDREALERASRQLERASRVLTLRRRRLQRLLERLGLQTFTRAPRR